MRDQVYSINEKNLNSEIETYTGYTHPTRKRAAYQ